MGEKITPKDVVDKMLRSLYLNKKDTVVCSKWRLTKGNLTDSGDGFI